MTSLPVGTRFFLISWSRRLRKCIVYPTSRHKIFRFKNALFVVVGVVVVSGGAGDGVGDGVGGDDDDDCCCW